jgi:hypothetical protein
MKKDIVKLMALLLFGAAALSGCAIENQGRYKRGDNDRRYRDRHHHRYYDRYHGYDCRDHQ